MTIYNFNKNINPVQLAEELKINGINNAITFDKTNNNVIIECLENPTAIVNAHIPKITDIKSEYAALTTNDEKIELIAKKLGLK